MSADTILEIQTLLGNYFNSAMGGGIYVALLAIAFFAVLAFFLHLPLEVCIAVAVPLLVILASSGGLPEWVTILVIMGAGVLVYLALMRLVRR